VESPTSMGVTSEPKKTSGSFFVQLCDVFDRSSTFSRHDHLGFCRAHSIDLYAVTRNQRQFLFCVSKIVQELLWSRMAFTLADAHSRWGPVR